MINWLNVAVWLNCYMKNWLNSVVLLQHGLVFNHAQEGYVMMTRWLPTSEPSMIPEYANQYLGNAHVNT